MKKVAYILRIAILLAFVFVQRTTLAQTKGLIFEPATGAGKVVLDPNLNGFISATTAGFISNDKAESEIPYAPLVFPGTEPTSDLSSGPSCGFSDFVDSGTEDPALSYIDGSNNWLFRFRLATAAPNAKSYSILIDTDNKFGNTGPNADPQYNSSNPGFEIELVMATKFGVFVYDVNSLTPSCSPVISYAGTTNYQKAIAHSTICGTQNIFLDFYVPFSALTTQFGITPSTPMRMAIVDNMAAQKSTICNSSSASDIGGVDSSCGSLAACYQIIIDNAPPCTTAEINAGTCLDRSACPTVTGPLAVGATSVSGTSTEASGTTITVYKNGISIASTTVSSGTWTLSGISPALASNNIITATALASGKAISLSTCNGVTVAATCTAAVSSVTECNKGFFGVATIGATIRLYNASGVLQTAGGGTVWNAGTSTVTASSFPSGLATATDNFLWKPSSGATTNCNSLGTTIPNGAYYVTAQSPGQCESTPLWFCIGGLTATATPTISTAITSSTTSVSGTVPTPENIVGVTVYLYANNILKGTATTTAGGAWTISSLTFAACDVVKAIAIKTTVTAKCPSAYSTSVTVTGGVSDAPIVSGTYCVTAPITTVSGISSERAGTTIQVFENGVAEGSTTTVASNGTWTATSGISIAVGSTITARATNSVACETQSVASTGVVVTGQTTNAVAITTSPVVEQSTSVSGTGTNGDVITLFMDGSQIASVSATVAGGVWTVSGIPTYEIYTGGTLTAKATSSGKCASAASTGIVVTCITPLTTLVVDPANATTCSGSIVANIQITGSENLIIYQLYLNNQVTQTGSSVLGTGGTITLTSGVLTASTTLKVKALKFSSTPCESFLTDNIPVTVNANPSLGLTVSTAVSSICQSTSTTIDIQSSQSGFSYQLRNNADNSLIGSAVAGTGGTISLPTGNLSSNTTFNILVTGVSSSFCSGTLTTTPTVSVVSSPTTSLAGSNQGICSRQLCISFGKYSHSWHGCLGSGERPQHVRYPI